MFSCLQYHYMKGKTSFSETFIAIRCSETLIFSKLKIFLIINNDILIYKDFILYGFNKKYSSFKYYTLQISLKMLNTKY